MSSFDCNSYNESMVMQVFGELAIDKSRLPSSGLTALGVPSFVGEWLLDRIVPGRGSLTIAEQAQLSGFVQKAFPRKDDKQEILFHLTQGQVCKLIALVQVRIRLESGKGEVPDPVARIPILNLENCRISIGLVDQHRLLLRQGVWGKVSLSMKHDGQIEVIEFDPFQCSKVDLDAYAKCRSQFEPSEWRDLILCSMGFNPLHPEYSSAAKTWILARLLPLVEPNYHLMELAPKGTGKSFVYENISNRV